MYSDIEHEDDEKFQTAINFYKYIREIKSVVMKPVYSTDGFINMLGNCCSNILKLSGLITLLSMSSVSSFVALLYLLTSTSPVYPSGHLTESIQRQGK